MSKKVKIVLVSGTIIIATVAVVMKIFMNDHVLDGLTIYEGDIPKLEEQMVVEESESHEHSDEDNDVTDVGDITVDESLVIERQEQALDTVDDILRPGIGWSDGELSQDELDILRESCRVLYSDMLNDGASSKYDVSLEMLSTEELSNFRQPVFYYVEADGVLAVNLKFRVVNTEKDLDTSQYIAMFIKYDRDVLKLYGIEQ